MSKPRLKPEVAAILRLGAPIAMTQIAHNGMSVTDTIMAGQVSPVDLAGVAVGSSIWIPLFLFMTGVIIATTALISHAFGAKRDQDIVDLLHQSLWLALGLATLGILICNSSFLYLGWLNIDKDVQAIAEGYLRGISWGLPAIAIYQVLRCYCEAQTDTGSVMVLTLIGLAINIPANYVLIFGGLGLPPLGGIGCGYASAIVMWCSLFLMILYLRFSVRYRHHRLFSHFSWPCRAQLSRLLRLGLPIGLAIFFEAALFCAASLAIAPFGPITLAAHQIAISFTSLTFMIPLSLAMASTVRVGNLLGQEQFHQARFSSLCTIGIGLCFACVTASLMIFAPQLIVAAYTPDLDVQQLAIGILWIAALFQFSDAIQVTSSGALRAYKDTRAVMVITFIAYWVIGFPAALVLSYWSNSSWLQGANGFWLGLVIGLSMAAWLLSRRLMRISSAPLPAA